jgi:hypothetical protein
LLVVVVGGRVLWPRKQAGRPGSGPVQARLPGLGWPVIWPFGLVSILECFVVVLTGFKYVKHAGNIKKRI